MAPLSLKRPMSGKPQLEWTVCEHETEWVTARQDVQPARQPPVRPLWRRAWVVLAALLLIIGTGGTYLLVQADREMAQVEAELATTLAAESWTRRHAPEAVAAWVDPAADPVWQNAVTAPPAVPIGTATTAAAAGPETQQVRGVEVHGEWALVQVEVDQPEEAWLPSPYRQTRIYRETPSGWRRTAPAAFLWQPVETHQAGRFTFVFGQRDAAAVREAALQVVEVDRTLRHDLGLPETEQRLTVHVAPALPPTLDPAMLYFLAGPGEMRVPSPTLLALPPDLTNAAALRQVVSEVLVPQAVAEATGGDEVSCRWVPLQIGLVLRLQAEHSQLPSSSRFRLAYGLSPKVGAPDVLQVDDCGEDDNTRYAMARDAVDATTILLVEYALSTYGRECLAALAAGMQRHASWQDLVPAVLGVGLEQFEAGWQDFLVEHSRVITGG